MKHFRNETAQDWKTGKYFFRKDNRPTFQCKLRESSFTDVGGSVANSLHKFHFRASLSLYYRSPDGTATKRCYGECRNDSRLVIVLLCSVILAGQDGYSAATDRQTDTLVASLGEYCRTSCVDLEGDRACSIPFDRSTVKRALQNTQNDCHQWLSRSFRPHQVRY